MAQSISILKKSLASFPPALDFNFLNTEGIKYLQQLGGSVWTDYNEHDPGVTILEQLCYAITDLAYRAGFDIKDIVATGETQVDDRSKEKGGTFFTASQALTCSPVTIADMNKYIIDSVEEVVHAWTEIADTRDGYKIYIEAREKANPEAVKSKILQKLSSARNLCEQVNEIVVLKPQPIMLTGIIDLEDTADANEVMAEIFYNVGHFLSHGIRFYTLREMIDSGYTMDQIFRGPALERGFIKDEEMPLRRKEIHYSKLTAVILHVPGVKSVRSLKIDGGDDYKRKIDEDHIAVLNTGDNGDDAPFDHLQVMKGNIRHSIDEGKVKRKHKSLLARNTRQYAKMPLEHRDTRRPEGVVRDISYYHSIQHGFPRIYGINKGGVPESYPAKRKAQAKQLKAYLLFFEQLMADYLKQLRNAGYLFSIDKSLHKTYFYCDLNKPVERINPLKPAVTLEIIPDMSRHELLKQSVGKFKSTPAAKCVVHDPDPKDYSSGMKSIVKGLDDFTDRRNRMANHLLARFGERVTGKLLIDFNQYYPEDRFRKRFIDHKLDFLKAIPALGASRAKGFNMLQDVWGAHNRAGLEKRVCLLLGINDSSGSFHHNNQYITDAVFREGVWFHKARYTELEETHLIRPASVDLNNDSVEGFISIEENVPEADAQRGKRIQRPANVFVDEDIMKGGFDISRYKYGINRTGLGEEIIVVYDLKANDMWRRVGEFRTEGEAEHAIRQLVDYVRRLNIDSEGFYLIEHSLLNRADKQKGEGIELKDEAGNVVFRSAFRYADDLFHKTAEEIINAAHHLGNYRIYEHPESGYLVQLMRGDRVIAMHPNPCRHHNEATSRLQHLFSKMKKLDPSHVDDPSRVGPTSQSQPPPPPIKIAPGFYPFTITIVLPSWSARFSNDEFQKVIINTFRANTPAHIKVNYVWLDPFELRDFEKAYKHWLRELKDQSDKTEFYRRSQELSWMLHKYLGRKK